MFKVESYLTPILMSYVDKYIKDFRQEDSKVSLWGGDACFHNLDLRLEVLEEELQLPFSFVSGHIHELLFHVPWTKLASEPITITINTIECILKLRSDDQASEEGGRSSTASEKKRKSSTTSKRNKSIKGTKSDELVTPPGYIQNLVTKIVNNITIYCNNLILKYVEEDIVLSVNIKTVKVQSANEKWEPAFAELSPLQNVLRKLITLSDLTVCLDKRNSSGKIELYQEPLLYRCVLELHLLRSYHSSKSKQASITRLDFHCFRMDFSLTEQQIPMLMRLIMLVIALQKPELKSEKVSNNEEPENTEDVAEEQDDSEKEENEESWVGWAWSWVPSILPVGDEEDWNTEQQVALSGHTLHLGVYIDQASVSFKVTESTVDRNYYGPRKVKFVPFLVAQMNGVFMDMVSHEPNWLNVQTGISFISLEPCGHCFCGVMEVSAEPDQQELLYFSAGSDQNNYILDSLFDPNSVENRGERKTYNVSWDYHVHRVTETLMLERSPALAFDLLHYLEIPEDYPSDKLTDIGTNLEYSNLIERSLLRVVVGPVEALLCAGLIHRISMIQCAANAYDYDPYITPKQEPSISSLTPVSTDDFESLEANIPMETMQFTLFKPTITLCQLDHPNFDQSIFHNHRKRRKSTRVLPLFPRKNLPLTSISCQCLDAQWVRPLYPERLVRTVCQLPDAPQHMFDACHEKIIVKLVGVVSQLHSGSHNQKILLPCNLSFNWTSLLLPSLWKNSDVLLTDINITAECMVTVFTKPQLMILLNIFLSLNESRKSSELLYSTSLLSDAFPDAEAKGLLDFLEVTMEGVSGQCVYTADTQAFTAELGAVKVFILEASKNERTLDNKQDQVLVLSGPDKEDSLLTTSQTRTGAGGTKMCIKKPSTLFYCTIQGPLDPNQQKHPPVLFFCINPISMNVDPVFRRWLMYMPEMYQGFRPETMLPESITGQGVAFATSAQKRSRRFSEAGSSHRSPNPRESVHSSSDREPAHQQMDPVAPSGEAEDFLNKESEEEDCKKERNSINSRELLLRWYPAWRGMVISGDISHCIVYIPTQSLSAVDSSCISDALHKSWKTNASLNVMVIQFPYITLRSTNQRQSLSKHATQLPVKLTDNIWSPSMVNFPWSMALTDTCIYTVQKRRKLHFLKPCSTTVTIGISTKPPPQVEPSTLTSVCLAVHVDASPVNIAISEEQVALMMEMTSCLSAMNTSLTLVTGKTSKAAAAVPTEVTTPLQTPTSPTMFQESSASLDSPALKRADTDGSSERGVGGSTGSGNIKITAWMQCTLARLCVTIYAFERLKPPPLNEYKLLMEMEDIMTSFDVQQIYFKMKLKVASANVRHFTRLLSKDGKHEERGPWCPGPFLGVAMRPHEDSGGDAPSPSHHPHHHRSDTEDSGGLGSSSAAAANGSFLAATFTRARCVSVHSRWGTAPTGGRGPPLGTKGNGGSTRQASAASRLTVSVPVITHKPKHRRVSPASAAAAATNAPSGIPQAASAGSMNARFISEVIIKMQAVDFVLSPFTLQAFVSVMQPMLLASPSKSNATKTPDPLLEDNSFQLNGSSLPLLYLETRAVRLIIPASELVDVASSHDVFVLQYDNVSLSPQAENPLSRVLVRPDIYHWAEQAGVLRIPGSGIEDRQYQLDVSGLSVSTGRWQEFERVLSRPSANVTSSVGATGLRTMSENPALEWNQLQGSETIVPHVSLLPVIARADLCVVAAPAIVLEDGILVCGHSLEINALKDIEMSASTQQLFLASALGLEIANILGLLVSADPSDLASKTKAAKSSVAANTAVGVVTNDSGVDSVDVSSIPEDSVSGISYLDAGATSTRNNKVPLNGQHVRLSGPDEKCDELFRNAASVDMKRQRTSTISGKSVEKSTNIIPFEILLTSRSWSCRFYDVVPEQHPSMSPTEAVKEVDNSSHNPIYGVNMYKKDTKARLTEETELKSELESSLSNNSANKTQPLLYIQLVQPHTFISRQALTRKIQVSCFDVSIKTSRIEDHSLRDIPTIEDFNCGILETRGGDLHPGTGIPPSFLTIRWSCTLMKAPKLDVNVGRPCKILLSVPRMNSLLVLKNKFLQSFEDVTALTCHANDNKHTQNTCEKDSPPYLHTHFEKDLEVCLLKNLDDKDAKLGELKQDKTIPKEEEVQIKDVKYESKDVIPSGPARVMHGFSSITLSTQQIVIAASTEEEDEEGAEVLLCVSGLNSCVTALGAGTRGAPESIAVNSSIHCLTLTTKFNGTSRLLINPWNFTVESCLAWETWHPNSPLMTLNVNSDCILLDVGPEHLCCLFALQTAFSKLIQSSVSIERSEEKAEQEMSQVVTPWTQRNVSAEVEQQYRDDLRAGAFQFVQSQGNLGRREELPLPYQVVFNTSPPTMAWRYPQPRMLTRVEIFPVPFRVAKTEDSSATNKLSEQVLCELQCWSEVRSRWLRVVQFELSESETRRLQLRPPGSVAAGPAARMWRVRLAVHRDSDDEDDRGDNRNSTPAVIVCPQTLAACMRVDSYFSPALVPYLQVAVDIAKIEVSLANHCGIPGVHPMPPPLTRFSSDCVIPDSQTFAVASIGNVSLSVASWQSNKCSVDASGLIQVDIIDYAYLTQYCALEPFRVHIMAALAGESWSAMELSFVSRPISLRFGPALAHTLAVSMQLWAQSLPALALPMGFNPEVMDPTCDPQVILTRYVICNDTNRAVRFGQVSTDEDLLLSSRQCHMYCWRSQKIKQLLKVSVDDGIWAWSSNFSIDFEGVQILPLSSPDASDALSIVVRVTPLSATQKQVTFSGQMTIRNNLSEAFECKIIPESENSARHPQYLIAEGNSFPPSLLISSGHNIVLRIRLQGLNSIWSGDIPLKVTPCTGQPWLVKVPLEDRNQFISIWCRVFHQSVAGGVRTLAMLCPLYMIQSHLPMAANIHVETPGLKVTTQAHLSGRGSFQQLYCPGTIDHSHKLMLQLDETIPSNPYVPLSYSMIDEQSFFKPNWGESLDVDKMAEFPFGPKQQDWPFVNAGLSPEDWRACEKEPQTYVQVNYRPLGPYCATLLVELRPWVLLVNTLGVRVSVRCEDNVVCSVASHGVSMPPRLESTFHLIVDSIHSGSHFTSPALQLARPDWTHSSFYMPRITGLIPREGNLIVVAPDLDSSMCVFNIHSSVVNEMRIVHFRPAFVFVNAICTSAVKVGLIAVPTNSKSLPYESSLQDLEEIELPSDKTTLFSVHKEGTAMLYWSLLGKKNPADTSEVVFLDEKDLAFYVVISLGFGWSCPLRLAGESPHRVQFSVPASVSNGEDALITESFVLTYKEKDGQVLLGLHPEKNPNLVVHNKCVFKLACAQSTSENNGKAIAEVEHINWWCIVPSNSKSHYHLPDVAKHSLSDRTRSSSPLLVFGLECATLEEKAMWSYGIDISESQERFLYLPGHGDVRVSVYVHCYTSYVSVETVSHVEISARDIRARLLEHGAEVETVRTGVERENTSDGVIGFEEHVYSKALQTLPSKTVVQTCTVAGQQSSKEVTSLETDVGTSQYQLLRATSDVRAPVRSSTNCFIKGLYVTLLEDIPKGNSQRTEVIMLSLDNVCLTTEPDETLDKHKAMKIRILIGDLQVDNQMFQRGGFDFPVVLMGQPVVSGRTLPRDSYFSLSASAQRLIELTASQTLVQINITMVQPCQLSTITATDVRIAIGPLSAYIEDTLIMSLVDTLGSFAPGKLVTLSEVPHSSEDASVLQRALAIRVLQDSLFELEETAKPLRVRSLTIEPLSILLSVHTSVKLYIALDHTPLQFRSFDRKWLVTTPYRLGHALTMHYLSGALFGLGWVVGSLELLGSPSGLARTLGVGLHDFITLPYHGIFHGPWAFLVGISHGSASLMKHITAGTLTSVTKMASSVARNLDRLTLDHEHMARTEELRRHRPQGLTQGLMQGLQGLGISILGAVGGIAHHPIQSVVSEGASPRGLVAGVGLGLVGVVTKPLSGAAEFVALTGEGLLNGAGWTSMPVQRHNPIVDHTSHGSNSRLKYAWKLVNDRAAEKESLIFVTEATSVSATGAYEAVALVLCTNALYLVNLEDDSTHRVLPLLEVSSFDHPSDPTLVCFLLHRESCAAVEATSHDRIVDFVRQSAGLVHGGGFDPTSETDSIAGSFPSRDPPLETPLSFFVNPQSRSYFLSLLSLVKRQCEGKGFPVL